jgi:hypothetical protein
MRGTAASFSGTPVCAANVAATAAVNMQDVRIERTGEAVVRGKKIERTGEAVVRGKKIERTGEAVVRGKKRVEHFIFCDRAFSEPPVPPAVRTDHTSCRPKW